MKKKVGRREIEVEVEVERRKGRGKAKDEGRQGCV
jgi:hypothetical protein